MRMIWKCAPARMTFYPHKICNMHENFQRQWFRYSFRTTRFQPSSAMAAALASPLKAENERVQLENKKILAPMMAYTKIAYFLKRPDLSYSSNECVCVCARIHFNHAISSRWQGWVTLLWWEHNYSFKLFSYLRFNKIIECFALCFDTFSFMGIICETSGQFCFLIFHSLWFHFWHSMLKMRERLMVDGLRLWKPWNQSVHQM